MTPDERFEKREAFLAEFRELVHKYAGNNFDKADELLLCQLQECTSVYQPYIWSKDV